MEEMLKAMEIGTRGGRGPEKSMLAACHDDDNDIYIYIYRTHVTANNSTNNNVVFFFVSDLKI